MPRVALTPVTDDDGEEGCKFRTGKKKIPSSKTILDTTACVNWLTGRSSWGPYSKRARTKSRREQGGVMAALEFSKMTEAELREWVEAYLGCVNDKDMDCFTPLMIAVFNIKSLPLTVWLIDEKGADVNAICDKGRTAIYFARSHRLIGPWRGSHRASRPTCNPSYESSDLRKRRNKQWRACCKTRASETSSTRNVIMATRRSISPAGTGTRHLPPPSSISSFTLVPTPYSRLKADRRLWHTSVINTLYATPPSPSSRKPPKPRRPCSSSKPAALPLLLRVML